MALSLEMRDLYTYELEDIEIMGIPIDNRDFYEYRFPIMAALDDMMGRIRNYKPCRQLHKHHL